MLISVRHGEYVEDRYVTEQINTIEYERKLFIKNIKGTNNSNVCSVDNQK